MKTNKPQLLIAVDPGASLNKCIASVVGNPTPHIFSIEPFCINLARTGKVMPPPPKPLFDEKSVWIGINENEYYAVGSLARVKYNSFFAVKPLKNDSIVPKICAAIAVAHKHFNLPPKFKVAITTVLPPSEYGYNQDVSVDLSFALAKIITPAGTIYPKLTSLSVNPEGYGILKNAVRSNGNAGVVMCGFRNTSVMFSEDDELVGLKTSDKGFYQVLERVSSLGGGYKEEHLMKPIWQYMKDDSDDSVFKPICNSSKPSLEISKIKAALTEALNEYYVNLNDWLSSTLRQTNALVFCGGNAESVKIQAYSTTSKYVELNYRSRPSIYTHISSLPEGEFFDELKGLESPGRYLDIYCLWVDLKAPHE